MKFKKKKKKKIGILYWHILISKLPRFGKARKRNLIKFRKQKLRGTFRNQHTYKTELLQK